MRNALRPSYLAVVRRLAARYVAGPDLEHAVEASGRLAARGIGAALAYWNPVGQDPAVVAERYARSVAAAARLGGAAYASVKLPAVAERPDLLAELLDTAAAKGVRLHFDSLGPGIADEAFGLIERALRERPRALGCTLPGRWPRSTSDAERAVDLGVAVRVVKGEWAAPDGTDLEATGGSLQVVRRLAGRASHVSVGTHDPVLARHALTDLLAAGTSCDLEVLHGRPMKAALRVAQDLAVPVRVYVPFGEAYLEYAAEYLLRHPARVLGWLARDLITRTPGRRFSTSSPNQEAAAPSR